MAKHNTSRSGTTDATSGDIAIDAMPTKELFIDMLTRDIALIPAIIDLVDNSADGAKKVKGEGSLKGYWARLKISPGSFTITDNCGGISVETARKYAFRFGRPPGAPSVKHSVGQFGVGMKRAIFKMGRAFHVESTTASSRFVVDVDVGEWANSPKWEFEFTELDETGMFSLDKQGTEVTVTQLHADVAEKFGISTFATELKNALKARLQDPISKGLVVSLNGLPIDVEPMMMLSNDQIAPAYQELTYKSMGEKPVNVKLYCGLGRSVSKSEERERAGWHVYCNGRLILEGDKSDITGWGEEMDSISIPGFHGQYNHMRGFAYFDSDDPARLPWNTTKTGLNTDSPIYRAVKLEMMRLMRPVIDFLNRLKDEKQGKSDPDEAGPLESLLDKAKLAPIRDVETRPVFVSPTVKAKPKNTGVAVQRIQYDAPVDQVMKVKKALGAATYKEVGEGTFRYFYNAEVEE